MTLHESLIENYFTQPDNLNSVSVNNVITHDWEMIVHNGDRIEVDSPRVGIREWVVGDRLNYPDVT